MLPNFERFINRLRKMCRHHRKWARRQGIECYRVYDADVPDQKKRGQRTKR